MSRVHFGTPYQAERLQAAVLESHDQAEDSKGLARPAYRSRTQFCGVFRAMMEETPVAITAGCGWRGPHGNCPAPNARLQTSASTLVTFNAYRRMVALDVVRSRRVNVDGVGCPMECPESLAKA